MHLKSINIISYISLILLISFEGCSSSNKNQNLVAAGFENVRIEGELSTRMNKNFDRLEEEIYQPQNLFVTEKESIGWPGDKEGRTILGLVMDARASHRAPKYLDEIIRMLPAHFNTRGYMGNIGSGSVDEQQLAGNGWLLRGLNEYYEWTNDTTVLALSKMIIDSLFIPITPYLKDYPITEESRISGAGAMSGTILNSVGKWAVSSDIGCVFIAMDGIIHAYKNNPEPATKLLIDELITLFLKVDLLKIKAQTHSSLTGMRGLIRYATITGDRKLIHEVEKRWTLYKAYGMTENYENYNWFGRYDTWTEPCAIIDAYMVAVQLWENTGNAKYLEDAEMIYWNGIAITQRSNGGFGCDKCVGPLSNKLAVHVYEAYWCCTMRGGEGLARAAEYSCYTGENRIVIPFYRTGSLELIDKGINISQDTRYPFGNRVTLTLNQMPDREISISLFIPTYMQVKKLSLNGNTLTPEITNSFLTIKSKFKPGDRIIMDYLFDMKWVATNSKEITASHLKKALYGPLILGYSGETPAKIKTGSRILQAGEKEFYIEGTDYRLVPLYHLLDPVVSDHTGYQREVLFRMD